MSSKMPPIIKSEELMVLRQTKSFVLIDARAGANAKTRYASQHLAGALHVDLDSQLAAVKPNAAEGGRHPLPSIAQFTQLLGQLGITPESTVVIYDDKNGANAAARFWWMLRSIGHTSVQVLDGGMDAAMKAGYPISNQVPETHSTAKVYPFSDWQLPMAGIVEVERGTHDDSCLIIDVREKGRYGGDFEPLDLIAGHIPNAVNMPFVGNLDTEGLFLSPTELCDKYEKALNDRKYKNVIVHCGSGVTACHTLLAMDYAGMDIPKLYVGSWSEWSRNDYPMVTKG